MRLTSLQDIFSFLLFGLIFFQSEKLGNAHPIGGCHDDPVTGLPVAIEIGSMMLDPSSGRPVPILNVTIDPRSGDVIPVGGVPGDSERGDEFPILLGDPFTEPLSGRPLKSTSARLIDDGDERELEPMGGGYQTVLDAAELYYESRVLDALQVRLLSATMCFSVSSCDELLPSTWLYLARSPVVSFLFRFHATAAI